MKGSTVGRERQKDKAKIYTPKETIRETLKDLDFKRLEDCVLESEDYPNPKDVSKKQSKFNFRSRWTNISPNFQLVNIFQEIVKNDVKYLSENGLLDYSLLAVKIDLSQLSEKDKILLEDNPRSILRKEQGIAWYIGILDIFETWNFSKMLERWFKHAKKCKTYLDISAQPPERYAERFLRFQENDIFIQKEKNIS